MAFASDSNTVTIMTGGVPISAPNPFPVIQPTISSFFTFQAKIAATNVAQQLPYDILVNGVILRAKSTNAGKIFMGISSSVNTTDDGTGNGYAIAPGEAMSVSISNSNLIWVAWIIGDVLYGSAN